MNKKSKLLSLLTAFATVSGAGFSLYAAYTQQQVNDLISSLTNGKQTDGIGVILGVINNSSGSVSFDTLLNWINSNGSLDISQLDDAQKKELLGALDRAGYKYEKTGSGTGVIKDKDTSKVVLNEGDMKEYFQKIKNFVEITYSNGSEFVVTTGGGGTGGSNNSQTVKPVELIPASVPTTTVAVEKKATTESEADYKKKVAANVAEKVKDIVDSPTNKAVKIETADKVATWGIETKDITDKEAMKKFALDPTVNVANSIAAAPATVVPDSVKTMAAGKESSVVSFAHAEGTKLPWKAQVQIKLNDNLKNKKVNAYYIVNGVSYPCGQVVVDANGHVICNFSMVGTFVFVAA